MANPVIQSNASGTGAGYYYPPTLQHQQSFYQAPAAQMQYQHQAPAAPMYVQQQQPHLPKKWFPAKENSQVMPANVHVQQSPMQHLQQNLRVAHPSPRPPAPRAGNAPPTGSWNRQYGQYPHPNER